MQYKDYYKSLGVERTADKAEIKKAYRKLARKYHPDVSKEADAEEQFKDISEAYNVLRDDEKRAAYDDLGTNWQAGQDFHTPPGWRQAHTDFDSGADGSAYYGSQGGSGPDASDFFDSLFGRAGFGEGGRFYESSGGGVGQDQHARVQIELADAYHGTSRQLSLSEPFINESGQLVNRQRTLSVKIPRGISQGQTMRLQGQGVAAPGSGARGDLYLEVTFAPHPVYRVEGKDISLDLPVAPWEAALGGKVAVPLPDGSSVNLRLAAGSSGGKQLRLKGKGIPSKTPGNLLVTLRVVVPEQLSKREQEAFESLREASEFDPRAGLRAATGGTG